MGRKRRGRGHTRVRCIYCRAYVRHASDFVPPVGDRAWGDMFEEGHSKSCEWVRSQAHRVETACVQVEREPSGACGSATPSERASARIDWGSLWPDFAGNTGLCMGIACNRRAVAEGMCEFHSMADDARRSRGGGPLFRAEDLANARDGVTR